MYTLTDEEWECVRVCVANAPIPYDITHKKIPANILKKNRQSNTSKRRRFASYKIRFNDV